MRGAGRTPVRTTVRSAARRTGTPVRWLFTFHGGRARRTSRLIAVGVSGIGLALVGVSVGGLAPVAGAPAVAGVDTCGYPTGTSGRPATVFNEDLLARWIQVNGSGSAATISVFASDENSILLGVTTAGSAATVTPFAASAPGVAYGHASSPSLGDLTKMDPSGRPEYPAIFVTNLTTDPVDASSHGSGDWQLNGSPHAHVDDVFGTWVVGSYDASGNWQKPSAPALKNETSSSWILGPGSDTPTNAGGFATINAPNAQIPVKGEGGYGTEFRWNASSLVDNRGQPLTAGNTYRIQVLVHDGDQNKTGGDAGELCTNLSVPGSPSVSVLKTGPASATPNGNGTYTLQATNTGTASAPSVTITDTLPVGETYVSASNPLGTCTIGGTPVSGTSPGVGQTITCPIGTLAAGASASVTVTVSYGPNSGQAYVDCATVAGQAVPSCVTTVNQALLGHIYLCSNGSQTTTEVPGGAIGATGSATTSLQPNPLVVPLTPAGPYTVSAVAPPMYAFVACGGAATIASSTSASMAVTVPSGGTATANFYVVATTVPPPVVLTITKTNDADGSGTYSQSEQAASPGLAVPFRLVVKNTSAVSMTISALTDLWPGQSAFSPACAAAVVGRTLAPGASATCDFTLPAYSPAAATSLTNTATVVGCNSADTTQCATSTSTSTVSTPATKTGGSVTLSVTKANDANGNGSYSQSETANGPGASVPFRVMVTNTSAFPMTLTSLSDAWPGTAPFSPTCAGAVVGTTLAGGASVTCDFTVAGYAPAAGTSLTDTVTVVGCQVGSTTDCATAAATSTVSSPPPTAAAAGGLAFTGPGRLRTLIVLGFSLLSAGSFVLWLTRPRRQPAT